MENIVVENLSFAYPESDVLVIKDLNMKVNKGDFVCILGQSGCGKSTLLRLLAGLETPIEGVISIDGKRIDGASLSRSVVFQDYGLFPWMSVGENIVFPLKNRYPEKKKSELKQIAQNMLQEVGLSEEIYDKFPRELSGGMKQRCAIAGSLSLNPPILLMDEPFGALDAVTRAKLQDLVLELWEKDEERKTVFFITHDVDEALLLANHIFVLGQSPSQVIYERQISEDMRMNRGNLFENSKILELRNELIWYINKDVENRIKQE